MIKKLQTFKVSIFALFLVSFASVFVCDYLCDVGILDMGVSRHNHEAHADQQHQSGNHDRGDQHKHTNGYDHDLLATEHHHNDSDHHETDQDDCCEEETNAMFSSLIKHQTKQLELNTVYFQLAVIFFPYWKGIQFRKIDLQGEIYISDLPPPKPWDLRILIQSFLN